MLLGEAQGRSGWAGARGGLRRLRTDRAVRYERRFIRGGGVDAAAGKASEIEAQATEKATRMDTGLLGSFLVVAPIAVLITEPYPISQSRCLLHVWQGCAWVGGGI